MKISMVLNNLAVIISLLVIGLCQQVMAQSLDLDSSRIFSGKIISEKDSVPVSNVHIVNLNSWRAQVSNQQGRFSIATGKNDILRISAIGYHTRFFRLNDSLFAASPAIVLRTRVYESDSVVIYPYQDVSEFKEAFLDLRIPDTSQQINLNLPFPTGHGRDVSGSVPLRSPITYFYNKFSRREKEKRAYATLIRQDAYQLKIEKKYNPEFIEKVTKLEDLATIRSFIEFCNLADSFIEIASEYELIEAIVDCYEEFVAK